METLDRFLRSYYSDILQDFSVRFIFILNLANNFTKILLQVKELSWIYNPSLEISSYFSECILIDKNSNECQFRHLHNVNINQLHLNRFQQNSQTTYTFVKAGKGKYYKDDLINKR